MVYIALILICGLLASPFIIFSNHHLIFLKKRITEKLVEELDGKFIITEISWFTGKKTPCGKYFKAYTEIENLEGDFSTNGFIVYEIETGKRLSKFVREPFIEKKLKKTIKYGQYKI